MVANIETLAVIGSAAAALGAAISAVVVFLKNIDRSDPHRHAIVSWMGGGVVVLAAGMWTIATFVLEHQNAKETKVETTNIAADRDASTDGSVRIKLSKEQIVG